MKLKEIEIANFKSYDNFHFAPTKKIVALTGKNGKGKSTLLEAIRYSLTGDLPNDAIQFGKKILAVALTLDDEAGTRIFRSKHVTKPSVVKVNDKTTPAKNLHELLETKTGVSHNAMQITTSFEFLNSLKPNEFGDFLLSYIPEELTIDEVFDYAPNLSEDAKEELRNMLPAAPVTFGMAELKECYNYYFEQRRFAKKDMDESEVLLNRFKVNGDIRDKFTVEQELNAIIKEEAKSSMYIASIDNYNKAFKLRSEQDAMVKQLTKVINENLSTAPDANKIKEIQQTIKRYKQELASCEQTFNTLKQSKIIMTRTLGNLNNSKCPISDKLVCTTDKTTVKQELLDHLALLESNIEELLARSKDIQVNIAKYEQSACEYHENEVLYNQKTLYQKQLDSYMMNLVDVPEKPVELNTINYSSKKQALQMELDIIQKHQKHLEETQKFSELARYYKVCVEIVNALSTKGIIHESISAHYTEIFENVCNQRVQQLDANYSIKFESNNGVHISLRTSPDEHFKPMQCLSPGEKALLLFVLMDMLNQLNGLRILMMDDLDKLDAESFEHIITLLVSSELLESYDHIFLSAVNHIDTVEILEKYKDIIECITY